MNRRTALKLFAAAPAALLPSFAVASTQPAVETVVLHRNTRKMAMQVTHPDYTVLRKKVTTDPVVRVVNRHTQVVAASFAEDGLVYLPNHTGGYSNHVVVKDNGVAVCQFTPIPNANPGLRNITFAHAPNGMLVALFNPHDQPPAEMMLEHTGGFAWFPKVFVGYHVKFPLDGGSTSISCTDGIYRHNEKSPLGHLLLAGPKDEIMTKIHDRMGDILGDHGVNLGVVLGTYGEQATTIYSFIPAKA